mgnify:CR=1 FL=1
MGWICCKETSINMFEVSLLLVMCSIFIITLLIEVKGFLEVHKLFLENYDNLRANYGGYIDKFDEKWSLHYLAELDFVCRFIEVELYEKIIILKYDDKVAVCNDIGRIQLVKGFFPYAKFPVKDSFVTVTLSKETYDKLNRYLKSYRSNSNI